jgi:hypothetical protein
VVLPHTPHELAVVSTHLVHGKPLLRQLAVAIDENFSTSQVSFGGTNLTMAN